MWCFTLLDLEHPHSRIATWEFAIVDASEDHATLLALAKKFRQKIQNMIATGVLLHGEVYIVDLYLSADQKFLHIVLGLKGCTSKYWCPWCEATKDEKANLSDMNKVWQMWV